MAWGKKKNPGYSYFAAGATLEGRLCFTGVIRLDGRLSGQIISSGTLMVEETAIITGDILVDSIILNGTVYGDITAFRHVQINASGKVYGHISYGELSIEGALHEGSSHRLTPEEVETAQQRCQEIMAEAATNADHYQPSQLTLEQYAAALSLADKQAASVLTNKKPDPAAIKKIANPVGPVKSANGASASNKAGGPAPAPENNKPLPLKTEESEIKPDKPRPSS
ncbi:MAG: polymer-forming cytoskeletal protein [Candidatus Adiutrix sp.]|jgi:cytoskeletal protein CcmA (bactofilin family)|nr:polymer-forming cytoskeletal protein [Candidatus Adiutrix sp.]